jgi:hypothetical protein
VTFGAVLVEKVRASGHGIGIGFKRIAAGDCFSGSFRQFGVDILLIGLVAVFCAEIRAPSV